jgi:hypothetical protein
MDIEVVKLFKYFLFVHLYSYEKKEDRGTFIEPLFYERSAGSPPFIQFYIAFTQLVEFPFGPVIL